MKYSWKKYNQKSSQLSKKLVKFNNENKFNFIENGIYNQIRDVFCLSILIKIFKKLKNKKKKIIGYGATAKSCTVLNYCNIGKKEIEFFYDTTSFKINKYLPGTKIKIEKYKMLDVTDARYVYLGAWNFKKEIFEKEKQFIKKGGKFIMHVPFPRIL